MKNVCAAYAVAGLLAGSVLATSAPASAQVNCSDVNGVGTTHAVYFAGSTAIQPVLQTMAMKFASLSPPISIIYQGQGVSSCKGLTDITTSMAETATPVWLQPGMPAVTCSIPTSGVQIDVGVSDVYPATCGNVTVTAAQKEFLGPIQVMTMVVPKMSSESSISADAAYTVFGFGGQNYPVAPWSDPTAMFIRKPSSGTINMIGTAIGLPAAKWLADPMYMNQHLAGSKDVLAALTNAAAMKPNAAIGILAADYADAHRDVLKILAYQHTGQACGYLPDSDAEHFDKINVRQGRYAIWGPVHLVVKVDADAGTGAPLNPDVATVISYFTGATLDGTPLSTPDLQAVIDAEAAAYTIPSCAMQVGRIDEVGAEASYQPDVPCGCYYESKKQSTVSSYCKSCNMDTDCSGSYPKCRYGFCEAK
jgi:hypothetical protein